jgi:hypothetical protein
VKSQNVWDRSGKPVLWGITYRLVMQFLEIHGLF